jgi:hypothetical protein
MMLVRVIFFLCITTFIHAGEACITPDIMNAINRRTPWEIKAHIFSYMAPRRLEDVKPIIGGAFSFRAKKLIHNHTFRLLWTKVGKWLEDFLQNQSNGFDIIKTLAPIYKIDSLDNQSPKEGWEFELTRKTQQLFLSFLKRNRLLSMFFSHFCWETPSRDGDLLCYIEHPRTACYFRNNSFVINGNMIDNLSVSSNAIHGISQDGKRIGCVTEEDGMYILDTNNNQKIGLLNSSPTLIEEIFFLRDDHVLIAKKNQHERLKSDIEIWLVKSDLKKKCSAYTRVISYFPIFYKNILFLIDADRTLSCRDLTSNTCSKAREIMNPCYTGFTMSCNPSETFLLVKALPSGPGDLLAIEDVHEFKWKRRIKTCFSEHTWVSDDWLAIIAHDQYIQLLDVQKNMVLAHIGAYCWPNPTKPRIFFNEAMNWIELVEHERIYTGFSPSFQTCEWKGFWHVAAAYSTVYSKKMSESRKNQLYRQIFKTLSKEESASALTYFKAIANYDDERLGKLSEKYLCNPCSIQ